MKDIKRPLSSFSKFQILLCTLSCQNIKSEEFLCLLERGNLGTTYI